MKTRQKINHRKGEIEILELLGNHFRVKPFYRLYLKFPFKTGNQALTRDLYSDKVFNLIHTKNNNWYAVFYLDTLDMYLLKKLEFIEYLPNKDIRKSHLYGKRRKQVS